MPTKSTPSRYGTIAVTVHWLTAMLIIALTFSGFMAANAVDPSFKTQVLWLHAPVGTTVVLLTLFRIVWWWKYDTKPAPQKAGAGWQKLSAKIVHFLFYVCIIGLALSGTGMMLLSGAWPVMLGLVEGPLPDFHDFLPRIPHGLGARVMIGLFAFHTGAALYHHFVKRDSILRRMWFGGDKA